jgi:hypothetical protein
MGTIPFVALGVAGLGAAGSGLTGGASGSTGNAALPFGLGEQYALLLFGAGSALVALLWWFALRSKTQTLEAEIQRGKEFVLRLGGAEQ